MGARAITILIGSVLGAIAYYVVRVLLNSLCGNTTAWSTIEIRKEWSRNSAICWNTLKNLVLFDSENPNYVTMGNQQERLEYQESPENIRRTPFVVKICSELMGNHERLAEMTNPS